MNDTIAWYVNKQVERTLANLDKHNMDGFFVNDEQALKEKIAQLLLPHSTVAAGDSMTLYETGLMDFLRSGSYHFLDKHRPGITSAEKKKYTGRPSALIPFSAVPTL